MSILSQWQIQQPTSKYAQVMALLTLLWIALPLLQQLPLGVSLLFGILMLARLVLTLIGIGGLPTWLNIVLMFVAAAAVYGQLQTIFGQEGGVSLLLLMAVIKSFEGKTTRDWQVLLVAALFLVAGGLLFQQTLQIGIWLILALLMVFCSLCLLNGMQWQLAWRNTLWALGLSLPLMVALFLLVPRLPEPLWRLPTQQNSSKTGVSTELTMGDMAQVIESNELAFNVTFKQGSVPQTNQLYWRVMVMNEFDGNTWRAGTQQTLLQDALNVSGQALDYEITLQDFEGHIPALEQVTQVDESMQLRENQVITAKRPYAQLRKVVLQSKLSPTIAERLNPSQTRHWLNLPVQGNLRSRDLARTWKSNSQDDAEVVKQALDFFQTKGFSYSLSPGKLQQNGDQVDQFLFDSKVGFCEHYASSFVVLMRAAGIPARVVTGYLGGTFNENGQFLQVRGKEAHAWAEVWLQSKQAWVRIDPTAVVSTTRIDDGINAALPEQMGAVEGMMPAGLQNWLASSQYYWQQWVVNYDADNQQALFARLGLGALTATKWLLIAAVCLFVTVSPILWWWRRQYRQRIEPLSAGFMLIKQHFFGEDSEERWHFGAQDLQEWLQTQQLLTPTWQNLLQQYNNLRYAQIQTPAEQSWQWYRQVKKALKNKKR